MSASRTTKRCRVSGRNCRFGNAHLPQVPEFANRIKPCGRDRIVFMRAPAFYMLRAMDLGIADHGRRQTGAQIAITSLADTIELFLAPLQDTRIYLLKVYVEAGG